MARMTASDMLSIVRASLGGETSEVISDTTILRFLNNAVLEIASRYRPRELIHVEDFLATSGNASYNMVYDANQLPLFPIKLVDETNTTELVEMHREEYDRLVLGSPTTNTGNPTMWCMAGTTSSIPQIYLYPTPDGTYMMQFSYYRQPTEMVYSPIPTSSELPLPWDSIIVDMACSSGWKYLGDMNKSSMYLQIADAAASSAVRSTVHSSNIVGYLSSAVGRALDG